MDQSLTPSNVQVFLFDKNKYIEKDFTIIRLIPILMLVQKPYAIRVELKSGNIYFASNEAWDDLKSQNKNPFQLLDLFEIWRKKLHKLEVDTSQAINWSMKDFQLHQNILINIPGIVYETFDKSKELDYSYLKLIDKKDRNYCPF